MGNLTGGPPPTGISGTPASEEDYTLDQLGNWGGYLVKAAGSTTLDQTHYHNSVNEIDTDNTDGDADASITASTGTNWADPVYDKAGNTTTMPKPADPANAFTLKYDAWNRLVEVKSGANSVQTNEFDGLGRRIVRVDVAASDTYDYYYNENWQLLEERKDGDTDPLGQYVWHPYYIDALAVRYYDEDTDNNLAENNDGTHYYAHDANFNVTDVTNSSGVALERYIYTPYGQLTFLNPNYSVKGAQSSAIGNNHFYTGRERDPETGLQLNRNRFYAPHLGRWVTRDPIGFRGGDRNLYGYAFASPLNFLDPSGLRRVCCIKEYKRGNDDPSEGQYPTANCTTNIEVDSGDCRQCADYCPGSA